MISSFVVPVFLFFQNVFLVAYQHFHLKLHVETRKEASKHGQIGNHPQRIMFGHFNKKRRNLFDAKWVSVGFNEE